MALRKRKQIRNFRHTVLDGVLFKKSQHHLGTWIHNLYGIKRALGEYDPAPTLELNFKVESYLRGVYK